MSETEELEILRANFEQRLEAEKLDALAEFAAGAGHEINNPLAIIGGHAQMLLKEVTNEDHRRSLAVIAAQVKRAYEMIADIRLFARPPRPEFRTFDLIPLLSKVIEEQHREVLGQNIVFHRNFECETLQIVSDPLQLHVVVSAIIKNAREVIGENGNITVSFAVSDAILEITVEDDGPGIPEDVRPLIFCPYFSARQAGRGLGFGLPKAWQIMKQCHGTISCENLPGKGVKFVLRLPLDPEMGPISSFLDEKT